MGRFGFIPKLFRMESNSEWKVITNGKKSEMKADLEFAEVTTSCNNFGVSNSEWKAISNSVATQGNQLRKVI